MKVIFLSHMYDEAALKETAENSKAGVQMATHLFQKRLLNGFAAKKDVACRVLSVPPIGSFPGNYRKLFVKKAEYPGFYQFGYLNLPVIKQLILTVKIRKKLEEEIRGSQEEIKVLIYSMYLPFLAATDRIRKKYPAAEIYLIQTDAVTGINDMPEYNTFFNRSLSNWKLRKINGYDGFALISDYLKKVMHLENGRTMLLECICDTNQRESRQTDGMNRICLYTGAVMKAYGIVNLTEAFKHLPDAKLWICGAGDAEGELHRVAEECPNIEYFGTVDQKTVESLRDQCDYLINPRVATGTYTMYSFPSKTVEYLASGKPAVMYRLEGIPKEYDPFLNYLTAMESYSLAAELSALFETDYSELLKKASAGRKFVMKEKNEEIQAERLYWFMKGRSEE